MSAPLPNAGDLLNVALVQTPVRTRDTHGGVKIDSWSTAATRRCRIDHLAGDEKLEAAKVAGAVDFKVTMGYVDCDTTHRLVITVNATNEQVIGQVGWVDQVTFRGRKTVAYCTRVENP